MIDPIGDTARMFNALGQIPNPTEGLAVLSPEQRSVALAQQAMQTALKSYLDESPGDTKGYFADATSDKTYIGPVQRPGLLSFNSLRRVYAESDMVRSIVECVIGLVVGIPYKLRARPGGWVPPGLINYGQELFENMNYNGEDYTSVMFKYLRDILILDAGVLELAYAPGSTYPVEIIPLDGTTFVPLVDEHWRVTGYKQEVEMVQGRRAIEFFNPDQIVYTRQCPRMDSVWGISPIETLVVAIATDILAMKYNAEVFTDSILSDVILVLGKIGGAAVDAFKAQIKAKQGVAHDLLMLSGLESAKDAQMLRLRNSNRDMEFNQTLEWVFRRACAAWHIEASQVMAIDRMMARANAEQAQEVTEKKGLLPLLRLVQGQFSREICMRIHPDLRFYFDIEQHLDPEADAKIMKDQLAAGRPLNELRAERNWAPIEGPKIVINGRAISIYDMPFNPLSNTILGDGYLKSGLSVAGEGSTIVPKKQPGQTVTGGGAGLGLPNELPPVSNTPTHNTVQHSDASVWLDTEKSSAPLRRILLPGGPRSAKARRVITRHQDKLRRVWKRWHQDVLKELAIVKKDTDPGGNQDPHQLSQKLAALLLLYMDESEAVRNLVADAIEQAAVDAGDYLDIPVTPDTVQELLLEYGKRHPYDTDVVQGIANTMERLIDRKMTALQSPNSGLTPDEAREELAAYLERVVNWQTQDVAVTEGTQANRFAGYSILQQWSQLSGTPVIGAYTELGPNPCDSCVDYSAETQTNPISPQELLDVLLNGIHPGGTGCQCNPVYTVLRRPQGSLEFEPIDVSVYKETHDGQLVAA